MLPRVHTDTPAELGDLGHVLNRVVDTTEIVIHVNLETARELIIVGPGI
jgi:hypothetical protein